MKTLRKLLVAGLLIMAVSATAAAPEQLTLDDCRLNIYWQGAFTPQEQVKMRAWLTTVISTMRLLNGTIPRAEIRIELQRTDSATPVPFARVLRSGPQGLRFYVNPALPLDDFVRDWTAYHEFTHLFIPYPGRSGLWLSEGLASYYQNILQYRAGLLSAAATRDKLREGFERGAADDTDSDLTLEQLSRDMHSRGAFMRVYWSGALYFLQADLDLRQNAPEASEVRSLDDVLRLYGECCLTEARKSGAQLAAEFDRIAGRPVFVPLYERFRESTALPPYAAFVDAASMQQILNGY